MDLTKTQIEYLRIVWGKEADGQISRLCDMALRAVPEDSCSWSDDGDGRWEMTCGGDPWIFEFPGEENNVKFCMHCGRPISLVRSPQRQR